MSLRSIQLNLTGQQLSDLFYNYMVERMEAVANEEEYVTEQAIKFLKLLLNAEPSKTFVDELVADFLHRL